MRRIAVLCLFSVLPCAAQVPEPFQGDFRIRDFRFASGETLPELRIHYRTLGAMKKDTAGRATNAVLILHGTTGSGAGFRGDLRGKLQSKVRSKVRSKLQIKL